MERGNSTHSPRQDEALESQLQGGLGPGGSNREEWADPEPTDDPEDPAPAGGPIRDPASDDPDPERPSQNG